VVVVGSAAVVVDASVVAVVVAPARATVVEVVVGVVVGGGSGDGSWVPELGPRHTKAKVNRAATSTPMTIRATVRPDGRCTIATVARVGDRRRSP
jgi:hypothetical protein